MSRSDSRTRSGPDSRGGRLSMKMSRGRQEIVDEDEVQQAGDYRRRQGAAGSRVCRRRQVAQAGRGCGEGWILSKGDVCKRVSEAKPAHCARRRAQCQRFECQMGNERLMRSMRGIKKVSNHCGK